MSAGDTVQVASFEITPTAMTPERIPLEIIFEDNEIAVVIKPAGMLVHPTIGVKRGTLVSGLVYHFNKELFDTKEATHPGTSSSALPDTSRIGPTQQRPAGQVHPESEPPVNDLAQDWDPALKLIRPGIVHRLDRATSGLLVVAKTPHALSVLSKHFRKGKVKKSYLAVVDGTVDGESGSISAPIGRDPDARPHWGVMESGRPAQTSWRVLSRGSQSTILELEPVTGRTNQLRIHCSYWGHPILGDELYRGALSGGEHSIDRDVAAADPDRQREDQRLVQSRIASLADGLDRLLLHAWKLAFYHPVTGDWLELTASPPPQIVQFDTDGVLAD